MSVLSTLALALACAPIVVCPATSEEPDCNYRGGEGLRKAVSHAPDGAIITIRDGYYAVEGGDEFPNHDVVLRAFLIVEDKNLTIEGKGNVIIDGRDAEPTSFMGVRNAALTLRNVSASNFRYAASDDDIYDGHGIYTVASKVRIENVTLTGVHKMALTGRDGSLIKAYGLRVLDSHIGLWLEEASQADIAHSVFVQGDTAGITAYGQSIARIANSFIGGYDDDGLYADGDAHIEGQGLLVAENEPYGVRAAGNSTILINDSLFIGNAAISGKEENGSVTVD